MYSTTTCLKARNTYNNIYIKYAIDWFIVTKIVKINACTRAHPAYLSVRLVARVYLHLYIKRLWILFTSVTYICTTHTGYINKNKETTLLYGTIQIKI